MSTRQAITQIPGSGLMVDPLKWGPHVLSKVQSTCSLMWVEGFIIFFAFLSFVPYV